MSHKFNELASIVRFPLFGTGLAFNIFLSSCGEDFLDINKVEWRYEDTRIK